MKCLTNPKWPGLRTDRKENSYWQTGTLLIWNQYLLFCRWLSQRQIHATFILYTAIARTQSQTISVCSAFSVLCVCGWFIQQVESPVKWLIERWEFESNLSPMCLECTLVMCAVFRLGWTEINLSTTPSVSLFNNNAVLFLASFFPQWYSQL